MSAHPESEGGRVVLITGASRGIGAEAARAFAAGRDHVVLCHEPSAEALAYTLALSNEIRARGGSCLIAAADLASPEGAPSLVRAALEEHGRIDVIIANASRTYTGPYAEMPVDEWDLLFDVNVRATWLLAKAARTALIESQGSFISVSSVLAGLGSDNALAYAASKAAIEGMTRSLARELSPHGVRVNCVAPGAIRTEKERELHGESETLDLNIVDRQAVKRRGSPTDLVGAFLFLADEHSRFMTGQTLIIDGGWLMR